MRILLLALAVLGGWCGEERVHTLGPYAIDQQKAFDEERVGKDAITLADRAGIAIHLVLTAERIDVEALARDEVVPPEQKATARPVTTPLKRDGLDGKWTVVSYRTDDGEVVTELGILGKEGGWVHWEINASRKAYDAQAKTIAAMIASIR